MRRRGTRPLLFVSVIAIGFSSVCLIAAEKDPEKGAFKPAPGPKGWVQEMGPPAVVKDWERDYPQYQPIGKGDTEQAPDLKPGTPNPPNIFQFGGVGPSSFIFDLGPKEPLEKVIEREKGERPKIAAAQKKLLEERYNLAPRFVPGVTMTRGKPVPMGPTARLKEGENFEKLGTMKPDAIKSRGLFPYLPLPHPLHATGGMVFPQVMTDIHPERERFDVEFDIPDAFLPEFVVEALGHRVGAAPHADLFAQDKDFFVAQHLFAQRVGDGLAHVDFSH